MADPIKTLASRFVSLPCCVRMEVARRLLIWRDENQNSEQTHNDGLYPRNPFAVENLRFGF